MHRSVHNAFLAAVCTVGALHAQVWSTEDLRDRVAKFHEPDLVLHLRQIAEVLPQRAQAMPALCAMIRGDHREYLLKIERLLDRLADQRWAVREDAERQLVEVGARAMAQIQGRSAEGASLEERIRSARVADMLVQRGTEEVQREIQLLQGLTLTAAQLGRDPKLAGALVSAAGHSDPIVVERAVRALATAGSDDNVPFLRNRLKLLSPTDDAGRRLTVATLAALPGAASLAAIEAMVDAPDQLSREDARGIVLDLHLREDSDALLAKLGEDERTADLAALDLSSLAASEKPAAVVVEMGKSIELRGSLVGVRSDSVDVAGVEGLEQLRVPRDLIGSLRFEHEGDRPAPASATRLFLMQGSLISGSIVSINAESVEFDAQVFGKISVARTEVQGIAIDPELDRLVGASNKFDRIRLAKDDEMLDGEIRSFGPAGAEIEVAGEVRAIPRADIAGIMFRRPGPLTKDVATYTRVDLRSGDRLLVDLGKMDQNGAAFVLPTIGPAVLPIDQLDRIEFGVGGGALWGFTIVADYSDNKVFEYDDRGEVVYTMEDVYGVWDVECLDNGNLLIVEFALGRIVEKQRDGTEVWSYDNVKNPYDADRLPNGNTMIADTYGHRVIEVDPSGKIVWEFADQSKPLDAERLPNGNTLIADGKNDRVIEIDPSGKILWQQTDLVGVWDADRLPNGNTLITQRRAGHRVFEVDREGNVVFEITDLNSPSDADRLPNGNTLVAEDGLIREFDRFGAVVSQRAVAWSVEVNRY